MILTRKERERGKFSWMGGGGGRYFQGMGHIFFTRYEIFSVGGVDIFKGGNSFFRGTHGFPRGLRLSQGCLRNLGIFGGLRIFLGVKFDKFLIIFATYSVHHEVHVQHGWNV